MAETGDLIREFKDAKPSEKAVIIVAVVAILGVSIYLWKKGNAAATNVPSTGTSTGQQAGYPTVGSAGTPVLPAGVNPLYDPNGNLVAFQNPGGNVNGPLRGPAGPTGPPGQTGKPMMGGTAAGLPNWFQNVIGKLAYGTQISPGGVDYSLNAQRFWTSKNTFFYAPIGSSIAQGGQGRVWLQLPNGQQHQLLTGQGMTPSKTVVASTAKGGTH